MPNEDSLRAGEAILDLLQGLPKPSLVLFLISGGASAIAEKPKQSELTLSDVIGTNRALVHSGAPIAEINAMKRAIPALNEEGPQRLLTTQADPVVVLERRAEGGEERVFIVVNTNEHETREATLEGSRLTVAPLGVRIFRRHCRCRARGCAASRVAARGEDPNRGDVARARRRPLSGKAYCRRAARSLGGPVLRWARQIARRPTLSVRGRCVARGAVCLLRQ